VFLGRATAVLTIVEDDFGPGRFMLGSSEYVVREDGVTAEVTVIRTNGHTGFVSVNYRTVDSSAIGGFDYVPTNTVLAFADGETRKTISIGILEDNLMEGAENFTVQLSNPTGNSTIGAPSSANVTIVDNDTNLIVSAGAFLVSESGPVNNVVDPGETVTVALGLRNIGSSATSNLMATLQTTPNLSPQGASTQSYGVLLPNGDPVFRDYTFTATGPVGFRLVATLALVDGPQSYGIVTYPFTLSGSATNVSCNATRIAIPLLGAATPYPSLINVSNVGGQVTKVLVTLNGFNHGWPRDVDVLLEGPTGQTIMLMSDAGGLGPLSTNVTLTFDDKVAGAIPTTTFGSGTYRPANYAGEATSDAFPAPAPQPVPGGFSPYTNTSFNVFLGTNPNGAWKLYVVDDEGGDSGAIENGWCLTVVTGDPVGAGTDLVLVGQDSPDPVDVGADLTYMYWITNRGPATATAVTFISPVTPKTTFVAALAGIGAPSLVGTNLTHTIGSLAPGASTWIQYVVRGNEGGKTVTNVATVQSAQTELTPGNNTVTLTTFVQAPTLAVTRAGDQVTLSWPASAQGFVLQQSDNITPPSWTDVTAQPSIVGNQKRVVVRADGTCRSYRLRKL
jgi:uncharacterized repeat protein (TIGR01451 family)